MSIKTNPSPTKTNQPRTYTPISPQQFLVLAKRNPGQAHALTAHGFRLVLGPDHSLTELLATVDDHGNVDTEAAIGVDDVLLAALMALAAALLVEAVKGDPPGNGTTVIVSGDGNEVTVQSSGGGDASPDDGSHGGDDGGGDGGGGENTGGGGTPGGGSSGGGSSGGDSSGGGANPGGSGN